MTTLCPKCKKDKDINDFTHNNKTVKTCISCREQSRAWREKNKERVSIYNKLTNTKKDKEVIFIYARKKNSKDDWQKFNSQLEAANTLNLRAPNVNKVINGDLQTTGGYEFKTETEYHKGIDKKWDDVKIENNITDQTESSKRILHKTENDIELKRCCKCQEYQELDMFNKCDDSWDKLRPECKKCLSKYREENKEQKTEYNKQYWIETKEDQTIKHKIWANNNREHINEYNRERRKTNINYKLSDNLRQRFRTVIKKQLLTKDSDTHIHDLLDCTLEYLVEYLENKFDDKMNWDNYGDYWHIDHIIPCSAWDLEKSEEQKMCFNYQNLQPLSAKDNLSKHNKYLEKDKIQYKLLFT
tara:strand:+ start:1703 stop:2773 length:1071 start_codon:yes stop_codon:yes gene_type:complete